MSPKLKSNQNCDNQTSVFLMKNKRQKDDIYDYDNFHDDNLNDLKTVNLKFRVLHIFHSIFRWIDDGAYHFLYKFFQTDANQQYFMKDYKLQDLLCNQNCYYNHLLESFCFSFFMKQEQSRKLSVSDQNHSEDKKIYPKQKKQQKTKILISKEFLSEVLNQSKMKNIRSYLRQNQKKYKDRIFIPNTSYSIYQDYLLLNTLKQCQDKIYANNMYFQLAQTKVMNSQRTLLSYYKRLYYLMNDMEDTQIRSAFRKKRNNFEISENIIKHLNLLIDAEMFSVLQKYVDQHKEQLENFAQSDSQYINKQYTLLEDCIILKTFKQRINKNCSYKSIMKCLSKKLKRKKCSIFQRLQNLFNCNKQKLIFCLSNNLTIKIKPYKNINSKPIIQNMKIIVNQLILIQLKQQLDTKNQHSSYNLNTQTIQHLMILMYVKKYAGQLSLQQIFLIISQNLDLNKGTISKKFYKNILPNLRNYQNYSQKIQKIFQQIQTKVQILQKKVIMEINSKYKNFKKNQKMLEINQKNILEADTFINKLNESIYKGDRKSIIDILKDIQYSIKLQNQNLVGQNCHQKLFFSDNYQKHNNICQNQSLCFKYNRSKKQRKIQKKKNKQKFVEPEFQQHNLTLTESLNFQNNLSYIRKKWHLISEEDEETVYDESLQMIKQDE